MQIVKQMIVTHKALTLVELLVTISIMALVIAISLPIVKPMLESNKTKSGADIVTGFLAQARDRAIEEGRPVGVTFERVLDYRDDSTTPPTYPYNGACVLMRQVAEPKPLSGFVKDVRVAVDCVNGTGQVGFNTWSGTTWVSADATEGAYWAKLVEDGDQIQFNASGPKYELTKGGSVFQIDMTRPANMNLAPPVYETFHPALFKVFRKPQATKVAPTMVVPVALPEGIVVDLDCSGMGNRFYDKSEDGSWSVACDEFCAAGSGDTNSVTIMFSPTGEVDRVYFSDPTVGPGGQYGITSEIPSGPIFLNIGLWERAGFWNESGTGVSNEYLLDSGFHPAYKHIRNYLDMNNYWVTIFPQTGALRVNRIAATTYLEESSGEVQYTPLNYGLAIRESRRHANSMHGAETQ